MSNLKVQLSYYYPNDNMGDADVYEFYTQKYYGQGWNGYICLIPTNHLIQLIRVMSVSIYLEEFSKFNINELRTRTDIPDEMKLEVLLLLGDEDD